MWRKSLAKAIGLNVLLLLLEVSLPLAQDTNETTLSSIYEVNQQNCGLYRSYRRRSSCRNRLNLEEAGLIANGQDAKEGMFPSYVQLVIEAGFLMTARCGGVLITDRHILTAAHCVSESRGRIDVYTGIRGENVFRGSKYRVSKVCPSRKYSTRAGVFYDLALLKLSQPVANARPACLPQNEASLNEPAWAVGLGLSTLNSSPDILQRLNVRRTPCSFFDSHPSHICFRASHVQGRVCQGDSGGPVYVIHSGKQTVVGLTSYGHSADCVRSSETSVFTDVYSLQQEIENLYRKCQ